MCLICLAGCGVYYREPQPQIVSRGPAPHTDHLPTQPHVEQRPVPADVPPDWIPPKAIERSWKAIVVHHSGTPNGNVEIFDRWHREKQWDGVGYDFVIGNGVDSGDGEVEVTYRWRQQKIGAHCKTPDNWANTEAIGICLVGNFDQASPTQRQMEALSRLVRFVRDRYSIPKTRIYGHNSTPGARETECPGVHFSLDQLDALVDASAGTATLGQ